MTVQLEDKKREYQASIVLHEGVKMYIDSNSWNGVHVNRQVNFSYVVNDEQIMCELRRDARGEK